MPNNADHMHYYMFSGGKYKRKLISKEDFTLMVLAGAKSAYARGSVVYDHNSQAVTRFSAGSRPIFYKKIAGKVYFPYIILSENGLRGINAKFRAMKHNKCLQCLPLDVYWNQGETNGTV